MILFLQQPTSLLQYKLTSHNTIFQPSSSLTSLQCNFVLQHTSTAPAIQSILPNQLHTLAIQSAVLQYNSSQNCTMVTIQWCIVILIQPLKQPPITIQLQPCNTIPTILFGQQPNPRYCTNFFFSSIFIICSSHWK